MNERHRRQLIGAAAAALLVIAGVVAFAVIGRDTGGRNGEVCDALELIDGAEGRSEMQAALDAIHSAAVEHDDIEVTAAVEDIWRLDAAGEDTIVGFLDLGLADDDC